MHWIIYCLILTLTWPIRWLSYSAIHRLGRVLGSIAFYTLPHFRKRAIANLTMASDLHLSPEEIKNLARASLENLMITCLEYPKLASESSISKIAVCVNPEVADRIRAKGQSVIFFCGHQANWEILFLEGSSRMPGIAIGRPISNPFLYRWVLNIREKFGGRIIPPNLAIKEGLRALKKGQFLGIVGDQGKPDSGFSSPFFGRLAYTSPLPAILACRTGSPVIVATTKRVDGKYLIHYSDPIWADPQASVPEETDRIMRKALFLLENGIREAPADWLWIHNRWKLQPISRIRRPFRHESIGVFLPPDSTECLQTLREIYPEEELIILTPDDRSVTKLIFNFSGDDRLAKRFKKQGALKVVNLQQMHKLSGLPSGTSLSTILKKVILNAP